MSQRRRAGRVSEIALRARQGHRVPRTVRGTSVRVRERLGESATTSGRTRGRPLGSRGSRGDVTCANHCEPPSPRSCRARRSSPPPSAARSSHRWRATSSTGSIPRSSVASPISARVPPRNHLSEVVPLQGDGTLDRQDPESTDEKCRPVQVGTAAALTTAYFSRLAPDTSPPHLARLSARDAPTYISHASPNVSRRGTPTLMPSGRRDVM